MKSKLFITFVVFELIIISLLAVYIKNKKGQVIGTETYSPINKEQITQNVQSDLKYFYEPVANSIDKVNTWIPYKATYTINNDSLNERFNYDVKKHPKTFRIITLGDSWTYGLYVDTKDNWSEKLEDKLNSNLSCKNIDKFEVINLGEHGYDIQYSIERFRLRGEKYNPDLVLWLMKGDDVIEINEQIIPLEQKIAQEMKKTGEFQKEVDKGINYPSWNKAFKEFYSTYGLDKILSKQAQILDSFPSNYQNPLIIASMPKNSQYGLQDIGDKLIKDFEAKRTNVKLFDNLPDLFNIEGAQFPTDTHPNIKGHEIIAESLFNYLTDNNLINCEK